MLQDVAVLTGATPVMEDLGIDVANLELKDLGTAKRVVVEKENTTIIEGGGKRQDIQGRIAQIRKELETTTSDYDKEKLEERLAKLAGGVAQINDGAATEAEMKEKKARVEDALHATRAAVEEGILPGGGVALLRCIPPLEAQAKKSAGDEKIGIGIVRRALEAPLRQIAENAGVDGSIAIQRVRDSKEQDYGYNAATDTYEDLAKAGVIDPTKVVRTALQNAASIATLLLTTEAVISEIPEDKPKPKMPAGAGMGGMDF
jgi:chaperonin GroEL